MCAEWSLRVPFQALVDRMQLQRQEVPVLPMLPLQRGDAVLTGARNRRLSRHNCANPSLPCARQQAPTQTANPGLARIPRLESPRRKPPTGPNTPNRAHGSPMICVGVFNLNVHRRTCRLRSRTGKLPYVGTSVEVTHEHRLFEDFERG